MNRRLALIVYTGTTISWVCQVGLVAFRPGYSMPWLSQLLATLIATGVSGTAIYLTWTEEDR